MIGRRFNRFYIGAHHINTSIIITGFVVILLMMITTHCGQKEKEPGPKPGSKPAVQEDKIIPIVKDTLNRELSSDPQYLNPVFSNDTASNYVQELIFDSLVTIDGSPDTQLVGRLAEKWEISKDRLAITFHLRKGIQWHDGKPFTAADVKFTFDMAMRSDIPAIGMRSTVEPLDRVDVVDPHAVVFHFKYPFSPGVLNIGVAFIVPKHLLDEVGLARETNRRGLRKPITLLETQFNRNPIGTGPYIFREWKTTQKILLTRNKNYWDAQHSPKIENVVFKIIANSTAAFNILQKGELDILEVRSVHYLQFKRLVHLHRRFDAVNFYSPSYTYVGWNLKSEKRFFHDRRVRLAMTHALDRKTFIDKVAYGFGAAISGPFYLKSWAYNPHIKPIPYDLEKAAKLLRDAGWEDHDGDGLLDKDGVKFEFEVLLPSGLVGYTQLASILQSNLKKLFIGVTISAYEWSVYLERKRSRDFDACIGGWSLGVDPDPYALWHSSQIEGGNNYIGYSNQEVDKLIEAGRREFDRDKRQEIYRKIHEIIHHDQPQIFVLIIKDKFIISKKIKNYQISPYGLFGFFPGPLSWMLEG